MYSVFYSVLYIYIFYYYVLYIFYYIYNRLNILHQNIIEFLSKLGELIVNLEELPACDKDTDIICIT